MQPLDLKVLDLELPHHRPSNRQPTYRQGTNRAGSNSHRPNRGRPDASRYQLHCRTLLPAVAKHGKRSGRPSLGLHSRVLSTRQSHGPILTCPNVSFTVLTGPPALSSVNRPPRLVTACQCPQAHLANLGAAFRGACDPRPAVPEGYVVSISRGTVGVEITRRVDRQSRGPQSCLVESAASAQSSVSRRGALDGQGPVRGWRQASWPIVPMAFTTPSPRREFTPFGEV